MIKTDKIFIHVTNPFGETFAAAGLTTSVPVKRVPRVSYPLRIHG